MVMVDVDGSSLLADSQAKSVGFNGLVWRWAVTCHHNHFRAFSPGPPGSAGARRELLDFMVHGKINRGRLTDHPAGRHSIQTNQCPPAPYPIFYMAVTWHSSNELGESPNGYGHYDSTINIVVVSSSSLSYTFLSHLNPSRVQKTPTSSHRQVQWCPQMGDCLFLVTATI